MKKLSAIAAALLLSGLHSGLWAAQGGTSTAQFLRIGQGARAEGMGGAFTAVADDAYAVYWNPAGLAQVTRMELGLTHLEYIEKVKSQYAALSVPVNKLNGSLGVGLTYIDMGSIERMDASGNSQDGSSDVTSYAGTLSWGQALGDRVAVGVGGKFFNQDLAGTSGTGFAADAGLLVDVVPDRLMFGASAVNIGPKTKIGTQDEDIPLTLRGGLAFHVIPKQMVVALDAEKERATDTALRAGAEYIFQQRFVVRGGYQQTFDAKGGLSAGLGFIWRPSSEGNADFFGERKNLASDDGFSLRIDYAYVDMGDFDKTHRIAILVAF